MRFEPDYPGAQVVPAHHSNYGYSGVMDVRAIVLHTPEEPADGYESTPVWFQNPKARASTHYYLDNDGDIIQMVPESEGAWAQGTTSGQRTWKGVDGVYPPWSVGININLRAISIEMEGYAATIHETMPRGGVQWRTLVEWILDIAAKYDIPLDRYHIVGHDEVANHKRDPGVLFDWDGLMEDLLAGEDEPEPDRSNVIAALYSARKSIDAAIELVEG